MLIFITWCRIQQMSFISCLSSSATTSMLCQEIHLTWISYHHTQITSMLLSNYGPSSIKPAVFHRLSMSIWLVNCVLETPPPPPWNTVMKFHELPCIHMWYATSASIASSNQIMNSAVCEEDADIFTFQLSITESFTLFWSISLSVRWKGLIPTYHLLSLFMLTLKACVLDHGKILGGRLLFQSGY